MEESTELIAVGGSILVVTMKSVQFHWVSSFRMWWYFISRRFLFKHDYLVRLLCPYKTMRCCAFACWKKLFYSFKYRYSQHSQLKNRIFSDLIISRLNAPFICEKLLLWLRDRYNPLTFLWGTCYKGSR